MKSSTYKKGEAFVFRLWYREISGEKISGKEMEILTAWKAHAEKNIDTSKMEESKAKVLLALEPYFARPTTKDAIGSFRKYAFRAAAVIIILLSIGAFFTYQTLAKPEVYTAGSGNKIVHLADGTVITLLPGAELTVKRSFPAETRVVDLKGDAIFSVAKSKIHPFVVRADGFSTKVLGTVFKISQSGKNKTVDLYEGKVAVTAAGAPISYLTPHQKWTNFGIAHTAAVISYAVENRSGKKIPALLLSLSFNDVSLKEAVEVLEKNDGIRIIYPKEAAEKKITADFTGGNTDENIEALAFILGLDVQKENRTYTLKK